MLVDYSTHRAISSALFVFISARKSPQTILLDASPLSTRFSLMGLNLKILWGGHGGGKLRSEVKGVSSQSSHPCHLKVPEVEAGGSEVVQGLP